MLMKIKPVNTKDESVLEAACAKVFSESGVEVYHECVEGVSRSLGVSAVRGVVVADIKDADKPVMKEIK